MVNDGPHDVQSAINTVAALQAEIAAAKAGVADCFERLGEEQQTLKRLDAAGSQMGPEYVRLAKEAHTLSIQAWRASIEAYQGDVDLAENRILEIAAKYPAANQ